MVGCSIRWCGNASNKQNSTKDGLTFHRFPKCPQTKEKWIKAARRDNWLPTAHSVVCSRHFTDDCFLKAKKCRLLYHSSVPTLMLPILGSLLTNGDAKPPESQALDTKHSPASKQDDGFNNKAIIHLRAMIKRKDALIKRLQSQNRHLTNKYKKIELLLEESKANKKKSALEAVKLKVKKSTSHFVYIKPGEEDENE